MYAQVFLLNGFDKPLWYKVPPHLAPLVHDGSLVSVPLQKRHEAALVTAIFHQLPAPLPFALKDIADMGPFPGDTQYHEFLRLISRFYFLSPLFFYQRIRHFLKDKKILEHDVDPLVKEKGLDSAATVELTSEQQAVVEYLSPFITEPAYKPTLVHGVTGSGKTEVYKRLIQKTIEQGKTVVLMLPEVTLALQFEMLLKQQLPGITIIGFHSATKIAEKRELWQKLMNKEPMLIVGVHLPILLPIANLGLIIIDEEHERGFEEKKHPKLNSKEIALWRAKVYGVPMLLGSATPCLSSLYNVQHNGWTMFSITKRFAGKLPAIEKVILTQDKLGRKAFWVSRQLEAAIKDRLAKKEQIIIFLNRRGYSFLCSASSVALFLSVLHAR
ncbi:unnamed protein product [Sphagnum tenellum]